MAVADSTIFVVMALVFIYLVVYRKSAFFGDVMFILLGIGTIYLAQANGWIGFIILAGGFGSLIYDLLPSKKVKNF